LGISKRPRRTGIINFLSTILIWPPRLFIPAAEAARIIVKPRMNVVFSRG
jgi:hypothetical protein